MRITLITIIALFFLAPIAKADTVYNGLVGYWPLDARDYTTSTSVLDRSGNGNTGTLQPNTANQFTSTSTVPGKIGQALKFNGVNSQIDFGANTSTAYNFGSTSFSVSAWVYPTANSSNGPTIIAKVTSNQSNGWIFADNNGSMYIWVRGNATQYASSPSAATPLNKWSFVVATVSFSDSKIRTYLNGVQVGNGTSIATFNNFDSTTNLFIGDYRTSATGPWIGSLDDVRIYNRALSATEVKQLYRESGGSYQNSFMETITSIISNLI